MQEYPYACHGAEAALDAELSDAQAPLGDCLACSHLAARDNKVHSLYVDYDFKLARFKKQGQAVSFHCPSHFLLCSTGLSAASLRPVRSLFADCTFKLAHF